MTERVHEVQAVVLHRRDRGAADQPTVTLTARVSLGRAGDVRMLVRPVVAVLADASGRAPRAEFHVDGGSSVALEGPPLAALFEDSLRFLKDVASGAACEHDHVFGLEVTFDLATGPFVTLEQPPFLVASARTFIHESGMVAIRVLGEVRPRERASYHAPARDDETRQEAFDLQIQARRAAWLVHMLESALSEIRAKPQVDVKEDA